MGRALELAEQGRGCVEPNPLVGAVLVRQGRIVGEGFHARYGGPHAEPLAIADAGEAARGATLYVTLEPCSHQGKTPPCVDAVLAAGIRRVVAAMVDPYPPNRGRGMARLREAGVETELGLLEQEARQLNAPFVKLTTRGLPFVTAKWAMSLDGKTATRTGQSRWISSPPARQMVHALRGTVDAVLVGIGTARTDDPLLTARPPGPRTATRVVADSQARLPLDSQLVATARQAPLLVATTEAAAGERRAALERCGAEVLALPAKGRRVDLAALMTELGRRKTTHVLLEGGGELAAAALDAGLVDKLMVFVAPRVIGGRDAPTPVEGRGPADLGQALAAARWTSRRVGDDLLIEAWLEPSPGSEDSGMG
ncbi:MAG: bifunctional diaminohydroxyphosphoribosylaminopyrimidine deaminase/5-amino-6-(5-phosphoribosylamino)uracil reductase RibD [Candidatus Brocadiia bacterium]